MNEPRMIAPFFEDISYAVLLSEVLLSDEFDLEVIFSGNPLSVIPQFISKGFGKAGVVKNTDMIVAQEKGHPLSIAEVRERPLDNHTIKTRENPQNLVGVTLRQQHHGYPTPSQCEPIGVDIEHYEFFRYCLFGSGFAGLGL
jgi:hypothetical protein